MTVLVELDLPKDWRKFRLPRALHDRLHELLDRQDRDGKLSRLDRREAIALAELVDMLSLMRSRAELATNIRSSERAYSGALARAVRDRAGNICEYCHLPQLCRKLLFTSTTFPRALARDLPMQIIPHSID